MKICWDNLEKLRYNSKIEKWIDINSRMSYEYVEECLYCKESFLKSRCDDKGLYCSVSCASSDKNLDVKNRISDSLKSYFEKNGSFHLGMKRSEETKEKISKARIGIKTSIDKVNAIQKKEKHPRWRGGVKENNLIIYDTYASKLIPFDEVRRNPENVQLLQVKCSYCGRWMSPLYDDVQNRVRYLHGENASGEGKIYCPGNGCRNQCPIYRQVKYPKGYKKATSREVQYELRIICFARDNYTCIKCGAIDNLHCHHIEGININPLESADVDMCITVCRDCHKEIHQQKDCRYIDLQCKKDAA